MLDPDPCVTRDDGIALARAATFGWSWTIARHGVWHRDAQRLIDDADVVVCHAAQDVIAEIAARRRPAIAVPRHHPQDEQVCLAESLERGPWPVLVRSSFPTHGWSELLEEARGLDGGDWQSWCDGQGARRFAETLQAVRVA